MDKSNILISGLGQCGGRLADTMRDFNPRYTVTYLNSALGDIKGLKYADIDSNVFIYSGTNGSSRDRDKARNFFLFDKARVATFINKYRQYKHMVIFASFDGGTGSGTLIEYVKLIKQLMPSITITVVGVLPRLKTETVNLENSAQCTAEFENEIKELSDGILLINNNKCDDMGYEEINLEAIELIDRFFGMVGHHKDGSIDEADLERVIVSKGYIILLKLPNEAKNIREAIKIAKEESIFALPDSLDCKYGAANVVEDSYDKDEIGNRLNVRRAFYSTYNNKYNFIALGGCDMPSDDVEDIVDEIDTRKKNGSADREVKGFGVVLSDDDNIGTKPKAPKKKKVFMDDDDIDAILSNPDAFRF